MTYYCSMREALKNLFSKQITLEDGSIYFYTVLPFELNNAVGNLIAVLQEYSLTKKDDIIGEFSCKLYRTKDGNWYDFEEPASVEEKKQIRLLKSAIDTKDNTSVFD